MYHFLDLLFTLLHTLVIGINLLGWIWVRTRKLHLAVVAATLFSWLVLGIWFGFGYCPLTDWQWQVKEKLGERNLPNSFIKYFADKISGGDIDAGLIDNLTLVIFVSVILISIYVNFIRKKTDPA